MESADVGESRLAMHALTPESDDTCTPKFAEKMSHYLYIRIEFANIPMLFSNIYNYIIYDMNCLISRDAYLYAMLSYYQYTGFDTIIAWTRTCWKAYSYSLLYDIFSLKISKLISLGERIR